MRSAPVSRAENLAMIADSVRFLVAEGKRVVYDAEHFFDGWREDRAYAVECLRHAAGAGAETVVLCDTNGSSPPHQVAEATVDVVAALGDALLAGDRGAARRRARGDGGHDQDLVGRGALRAHRRGQRAGARAGPRAARRHRGDPPAPEG